MDPRRLRWLTLVAPLGLLGCAVGSSTLYVLFGFSVFSVFLVRPDERADADLGRAASFAYLMTLLAIVLVFVGLGVLRLGTQAPPGNLAGMLGMALAALLVVHLLSFVGSYLYFDHRGG